MSRCVGLGEEVELGSSTVDLPETACKDWLEFESAREALEWSVPGRLQSRQDDRYGFIILAFSL